MCNDQTFLLNVEKRNNKCRFFVIRYVWLKLNKICYNVNDILSQRVYYCNRKTSAISLKFIRMKSINNVYSKITRVIESAITRIRARLSTIIICDFFSAFCRRLNHNRFLFFFEKLFSTIEYRKNVEFRNDFMNQYFVD